MGKVIDLVGQRFGKLTVLRLDHMQKYKSGTRAYWSCQCDCGNITIVASNRLRGGNTKSCGCLQKEATHKRTIDLVGKTFGRLTVTSYAYSNDNGVYWNCHCSCGNDIIALGNNLKRGNHTTSCGCYLKEILRQQRKYNTYDLTTYDYGVGYTLKGEAFRFDKEDYDKIKNYCWWLNKQGYVQTNIPVDDRYKYDNMKHIALHTIVMNTPPNMVIDHDNHDTADNRKCNLRICTNQENCRNQSINTKNTSGFIGVSFANRERKYRSYIVYNQKQYGLGYYDAIEDAIKTRLEAEVLYFGIYAPQKHLFDKYGISESEVLQKYYLDKNNKIEERM